MTENQTEPIAFLFEVVADEQNPADPATLSEVSRYVAQELRKLGYSVEPVYTSERGGELFEAIRNVAITGWQNREVLAAGLSFITTIIGLLEKALNKHKEKHKEPIAMRVKMTSSDGNMLEIEGPDAASIGKGLEEVKEKLPTFIEQSSRAKQRIITVRVQQPSKHRRK